MATRKKTTAASKVVEEPMQTKQAEETVVLDAPIESKSVGGSRTVEETIQTKRGLNLAKGLNLGGESGGGGGSGTDNYNDLSNRPQINSVTLSGNKSSSDLGLASKSQGIASITTQQDGTLLFTFADGSTVSVDLSHTHTNCYSKTAESSQPSGGMLPDVVYKLGTLTGATTFSFAASVSGKVNHYYFTFTSDSTAVVPTWPASITSWSGNCVDSTTHLPVIAASKTYEISVLDGNAIIKEW